MVLGSVMRKVLSPKVLNTSGRYGDNRGVTLPESEGKMRKLTFLGLALLLAGCSSTATLKLVAREGGEQAQGLLKTTDGSTGQMTVYAGGKTYTGTWVGTRPHDTTSFSIGFGAGRWRAAGGGGTIVTHGPAGSGLALLSAPDGASMRCEVKGDAGGGFGVCHAGDRVYDMQILPQ